MSAAPPMAMVTSRHERAETDDLGARFDAWVDRVFPASWPRSWITIGGYLAAGVGMGLFVILVVFVARSRDDAPEATESAGIVTDNIVHLAGGQLPESCFSGLRSSTGASRLTVSMEVGIDGKVRSAVASGEGSAMRACVEAHVKTWEFLPQAQAQQMILPFEVSARR